MRIRIFILLLITALLASCSVTKFVPEGEYLLRYSFMGYSTVDFDFKVLKEDRDRQLGVFKMYESSILLTEAVIEDALPPTQVVDDTLMFNVSAFRVPEGSVLEELIKRLPGVEVDENGGITVNGRTVSRILVDGQEYFGNDRSMATKNLPVNIIHRIKTYQRKSDLARITGIDDGEEETVMDLEIKPNMRNGWLHNIDGAIGKPVGNNDYGDWIIRESKVPEGYCKNVLDITIHVDEKWTAPELIKCVNIPDHYEFLKTDSSGNPLEGVKFRLEDEHGTNLGEYVSDKDGIVSITGLDSGVYYIRETETLEGFSVSGEVIKLVLDENYVIPETMPKMINYTIIQTGVRIAVTGVMILGAVFVVVSGILFIIRKKKNAKAQED